LIRAIPGVLKRKFEFWKNYGVRMPGENLIYMRSSFNSYGDVVSHLKKEAQTLRTPIKRDDFGSTIDGNAIIVLNDFVHVCTARCAHVFYCFPPFPNTLCNKPINRSMIHRIDDELHTKTSITILGTPIQSSYPEEDFFDARYHLMPYARQIRTKKMAELLTRTLDCSARSMH
jgi:hypothetical protein